MSFGLTLVSTHPININAERKLISVSDAHVIFSPLGSTVDSACTPRSPSSGKEEKVGVDDQAHDRTSNNDGFECQQGTPLGA